MKLPPNPREPQLTILLSKHPWERVAADLFKLNDLTYLMIKLNSKTIISGLKYIFSVPSVLMSDNGPQFDSSNQTLMVYNTSEAALTTNRAMVWQKGQ